MKSKVFVPKKTDLYHQLHAVRGFFRTLQREREIAAAERDRDQQIRKSRIRSRQSKGK